MKTINYILIFIIGLFIWACSSDSAIDCSNSDLDFTFQTESPTCTSTGSITVLIEGGDAPYSALIEDSQNSSDASSQPTRVFSDLIAGSYVISVRDANNCEVTKTVDLSGLDALNISLSSSGCEDGEGEITVDVTGGDGNYFYQLNEGEETTSNTFSNLSFGSYSITVRDGNDCVATSEEVKIGVSLEMDILPIIEQNCALSGCHLNVRSPILVTKNDIIEAADRIRARTVAGTMPPAGDLPQDQVQLIVDWVECGANNN